jgi:eukaryotic-like serine/threonine-protein kinase
MGALTMARTLNPAVRANLELVIDEVRWASAWRMAWVRLAVALLVSAIFFATPSDPVTDPSRAGCAVFVAASLATLAAIRRFPRIRPWASFSVPLIDVPIATTFELLQVRNLPAPWHMLPPNLAVMGVLVSLSALSLSRSVIVATAAMATPSVVWLGLQSGLPWQPVALVSLMPLSIAAVGFGVVSRIRALVRAARKKDLLGKYVLGERLGVGGMAEVFLATYSPEGGFERKVAIKRMLPDVADEPDSVTLFRREAELGAMLAHPNLVQVLDFGADEGSFFMTLEYVDGVPLSRLRHVALAESSPLPFPALVVLATALAEALDYLHTRTSADGAWLDLVHRDVNPPNILISSIGEVKLGDLGIARGAWSAPRTQTGMMRGKLAYSPPEQILGQPLDGRVDLYALGVTLHEAITSHRLFAGRDAAELTQAALTEPIERPSALRSDLPAELEQVVMQLLERDRERRLPNARALLDLLRALPTELRDVNLGRAQLAERVGHARALPRQPEGEGGAELLLAQPAVRTAEEPIPTRVSPVAARQDP